VSTKSRFCTINKYKQQNLLANAKPNLHSKSDCNQVFVIIFQPPKKQANHQNVHSFGLGGGGNETTSFPGSTFSEELCAWGPCPFLPFATQKRGERLGGLGSFREREVKVR
jgi:hypothetical protein